MRKFVVSREAIRKKGGKPFTKRPKIQRLVTPVTVQRKRHLYVQQWSWCEPLGFRDYRWEKGDGEGCD